MAIRTIGRRSLRFYGTVVGIGMAVALEVWRQQALSRAQGEALEGVWLTAADWSVRLGFPLNILTLLFLDVLSPLAARLRMDPFAVLLLGIVLNGRLIGALLDRLLRRTGRQR